MSQTPGVAPPTAPTSGLRCMRCGYSLSGLPREGACPECSTPVEDSLRGPLLRFSSPEYVASLHKGVFLIVAAIIGQILLMVALILLSFVAAGAGATGGNGIMVLGGLLGVGLAIASLVGWWLFSAPDPALSFGETGASARKVVRAAVIAQVAITLLDFVVDYAAPAPVARGALGLAMLVGILGLVVMAVKFFASMMYLRWLAPRLPDPKVLAKSKTYMWLLPLLTTVGVILLGLGPIIALVLYWNLLDGIRKRLKAIRAEQGVLPARG